MSTVNDFKKIIVSAVNDEVREMGLKQIDICRKYNIAQPRLSNLLLGKTDKFSIDSMVHIAEQLGVKLSIEVSQAAAQQTEPLVAANCRKRLIESNQAYSRSSCVQCGSVLVPGWECAMDK